ETTPGGLLADNGLLARKYEGAHDDRLIEFIKTTWMRFLYGSRFDKIARNLGREPEKYGPGWKTTHGLYDKAIHPKKTGRPRLTGEQQAAARAQTFVDSLPAWRLPLQTYLDACRSLKTLATAGGVVFHDPWDGAEVRWNPAQRARKQVPVGKHHVEARPWGVLV